MPFELIEPLRELFKDEVRRVGRELGLPEAFVARHPFPGPGLAVRILGEVTWERLEVLREADAIFLDEIRAAGLYDEIWQAFAVLLPVRSVGVMGDARTYDCAVTLRAVTSRDGMTAGLVPVSAGRPRARLHPHHQRGRGGEPRGLRHQLQAPGHHRVGVRRTRIPLPQESGRRSGLLRAQGPEGIVDLGPHLHHELHPGPVGRRRTRAGRPR